MASRWCTASPCKLNGALRLSSESVAARRRNFGCRRARRVATKRRRRVREDGGTIAEIPILVVDDDPLIASEHDRNARRSRSLGIEANSGDRGALDISNSDEEIDLLITDYSMPQNERGRSSQKRRRSFPPSSRDLVGHRIRGGSGVVGAALWTDQQAVLAVTTRRRNRESSQVMNSLDPFPNSAGEGGPKGWGLARRHRRRTPCTTVAVNFHRRIPAFRTPSGAARHLRRFRGERAARI